MKFIIKIGQNFTNIKYEIHHVGSNKNSADY